MEILSHALTGSRREDRVVHIERLPPRPATYGPWPDAVPDSVTAAYGAHGIDRLWTHQSDAIQHVMHGTHVVLSTGTASGKSACYQVPALCALAQGRRGSVLRDRAPS
ncbi:MAG: helicase, partial [Actinomycetia bacterium]|nr:helicase [Actinomycetes bacterium]